MLGSEASDVHLTSGSTPCFRIHGEITPQTDMKQLSSAEIAELLHPITPPKYLQEFEDRHDAGKHPRGDRTDAPVPCRALCKDVET